MKTAPFYLATALVLSGLAFAAPVAAEAKAEPTKEQIAAWSDDLDADEFLVRETATLGLIAAERRAIEPLRQVLAGDSLEATTRALHVLQQIGLSSDLEVQAAARMVLEETAAGRTNSVGKRAEAAIVWLNEKREAQAVADLARLGATIGRAATINAFGAITEVPSSIEIGPEWKGEARDLVRLKWIESIRQVVLVGEKMDDNALKYVAEMPELESLHSYRTKITDQGLAAIEAKAGLREVGFYYTNVTDGGLESLAKVRGLVVLKLYGTQVKAATAANLEAESGLRVDFRRGAYLGVSCETFETSCIVATVQPGSPAEKAGLRSDDVIVAVSDMPITSSIALIEVMSAYDVGDKVNLLVQRRTIGDDNELKQEELKLSVTLGEWDLKLSIQNNRP